MFYPKWKKFSILVLLLMVFGFASAPRVQADNGAVDSLAHQKYWTWVHPQYGDTVRGTLRIQISYSSAIDNLMQACITGNDGKCGTLYVNDNATALRGTVHLDRRIITFDWDTSAWSGTVVLVATEYQLFRQGLITNPINVRIAP